MKLSRCLQLALLGISLFIPTVLTPTQSEAQETVAVEPAAFGVWRTDVISDQTGKLTNGLPYSLFVPNDYDPNNIYPLVVYLHGAGERGTDNQSHIARNGVPVLAGKELQGLEKCFILAPQCPPDYRWVEVDWREKTPHKQPAQPSDPMRLAMKLIDELPREFSIDQKRIYLTGISMGGFGTWDLLARRPKLFAAAIPICGGADNSTAPLIKNIPIWTFHGANDSAISVDRTRSMVAAMRAAGASIIYKEYPGVDHNSWDPAYAEPNLYLWFLAQRKQ